MSVFSTKGNVFINKDKFQNRLLYRYINIQSEDNNLFIE